MHFCNVFEKQLNFTLLILSTLLIVSQKVFYFGLIIELERLKLLKLPISYQVVLLNSISINRGDLYNKLYRISYGNSNHNFYKIK